MVQMIFNNYEGQGQRNAQTLDRIIEGAVSEGAEGVMKRVVFYKSGAANLRSLVSIAAL